jgi:hypothetical protein
MKIFGPKGSILGGIQQPAHPTNTGPSQFLRIKVQMVILTIDLCSAMPVGRYQKFSHQELFKLRISLLSYEPLDPEKRFLPKRNASALFFQLLGQLNRAAVQTERMFIFLSPRASKARRRPRESEQDYRFVGVLTRASVHCIFKRKTQNSFARKF